MDAFLEELRRLDTHGTLCTTPLLLNLMISEYLRHEARDGAIQFDGADALLPPAPQQLAVPSGLVTQRPHRTPGPRPCPPNPSHSQPESSSTALRVTVDGNKDDAAHQ